MLSIYGHLPLMVYKRIIIKNIQGKVIKKVL